MFGGRENLEAIDFLKEFNEQCHLQYPGRADDRRGIDRWAGVSRPTYLGGLGFSLKWNMGWMNDTLRYMPKDPIHRKYHHGELTFCLIYAFTENFVLPLSHDEVVHGKGSLLDQMPGDLWQKFANLRLLYGYMCGHPGKKLLFMGGEFGQWHEWNHDESLQWHLLALARPPGLLSSWATSTRSTGRAGPARGRLRLAGFRVDRAPRLGEQRPGLPAPGEEPERLDRRRLQLHAGRPRQLPDRRPERRVTIARSSTPTPTSTAARTSATRVASGPCTSPTAAVPSTSRSRLPPLGVLFLKTPAFGFVLSPRPPRGSGACLRFREMGGLDAREPGVPAEGGEAPARGRAWLPGRGTPVATPPGSATCMRTSRPVPTSTVVRDSIRRRAAR